MDRIKINSVEELLSVPETVKCVEISQNEIIRYIYSNRYNLEEKIDLQELRNIFAKSISSACMWFMWDEPEADLDIL